MFRKSGKLLLDLFVVIIGVSAAFMLSNMKEDRQTSAERHKTMSSLKTELETMNKIFPLMSNYQKDRLLEWDSLIKINQVGDFYTYRYIQPQYNYEVLTYALEARDTDIVDFVLHEQLLKIHKQLKMLEATENYMTDLALRYQPSSSEQIAATNLFLFRRFALFGSDRAEILTTIAKQAEEILPEVEKRME